MPSSIEWTDETWNPLRGCSRVSEGCRNCYAETVANRFSGKGHPYEGLIAKGGQWNGAIKLVPEKLLEPWRWVKPRMIFVNSMSDLFHPAVPFDYIAAVFFIMSVTTRHTYQVLTKRPERMLEFFRWAEANDPYECDGIDDGIEWAARRIPAIEELAWESATAKRGGYDNCGPAFPYENVWLGVSVEDQATANERIPLLLQTPAAVRWISAEPLLGPIDLADLQNPDCQFGEGQPWLNAIAGFVYDSLGDTCGSPGLDWVVVGGESGAGARPMDPSWVRSLQSQCAGTRTPFFFKQWGDWLPGEKVPGESHYARCDNGEIMKVNGTPARDNFQTDPDKHSGDLIALRIGKKAAGRILDGREWSQYPVVKQQTEGPA